MQSGDGIFGGSVGRQMFVVAIHRCPQIMWRLTVPEGAEAAFFATECKLVDDKGGRLKE